MRKWPLFLYREANGLLAVMHRVDPSSDDRDPLFEPVFWEYERIIFSESSDHVGELSDHPILRAAGRQSMTAALQDLNVRIGPPMGNRYESAREWSRNWFAGIGHNEMNPVRLEVFSRFWSNQYTAVQNALEAAVKLSRK